MPIAFADIVDTEFECRLSKLGAMRPDHPQTYDRPMGQGGFGLTDNEIWQLTGQIMTCAQSRLRADKMKVRVPDAYPSSEIVDGTLGPYDEDVIARTVEALKAAGYEIVEGDRS